MGLQFQVPLTQQAGCSPAQTWGCSAQPIKDVIILVPCGTEALNLANNSANYSNFHMSSFYSCGAAKFLKGENKTSNGTVCTLPSHEGEAAPQTWNRSPFAEKIIPHPSFSFCTKMSELPCLVGQSHFISKFKFCFVVFQLYIYPSSQWTLHLRFITARINIKWDALAFLKSFTLTLLKQGNFMDTKKVVANWTLSNLQ